jgi:hypothetical protein
MVIDPNEVVFPVRKTNNPVKNIVPNPMVPVKLFPPQAFICPKGAISTNSGLQYPILNRVSSH